MCDGSHALTEAQYKERTERLAALFKKPAPVNKEDKNEQTTI